MVTAPPHTPFFLSLPYEHSINLQVGWNNTQCFIQSLFHYGHTAMVIQHSKLPFHGQCLPNIYFVQSLAATDRGKVTEPVKSFTEIEQKAKNQRGLPDTRSASSMKAIARNQFLLSLSVAYPLNNMKKKTAKRQLQNRRKCLQLHPWQTQQVHTQHTGGTLRACRWFLFSLIKKMGNSYTHKWPTSTWKATMRYCLTPKTTAII